jgi:hypothetical protein
MKRLTATRIQLPPNGTIASVTKPHESHVVRSIELKIHPVSVGKQDDSFAPHLAGAEKMTVFLAHRDTEKGPVSARNFFFCFGTLNEQKNFGTLHEQKKPKRP